MEQLNSERIKLKPLYFLPLKQSSSRLVQYVKDRDNICLTTDQAKNIYKKVEKDSLINVEMIKEEIEEDKLDKDNKTREENPYQDMIINNFEKSDVDWKISQMEH